MCVVLYVCCTVCVLYVCVLYDTNHTKNTPPTQRNTRQGQPFPDNNLSAHVHEYISLREHQPPSQGGSLVQARGPLFGQGGAHGDDHDDAGVVGCHCVMRGCVVYVWV